MKKVKLLIPLIGLLITGCDISFGNPSNNDTSASNPTSNGNTVNSGNTNSSFPNSEVSYVPSCDLEINVPKLATFKDERSVDPAIAYKDEDIEPLPSFNGFTYPSNAQVQPTNAYLDFWHPSSKVTIEIFADPAIINLMDQNGHKDSNQHELYWPVNARISVNERVYEYYEVGMRRKGNTSREHHFWDNNSKQLTDSFSFKLRFDEKWDKDYYAPFGIKKTWSEDDASYKVRDKRSFLSSDTSVGITKLDYKFNKTKDESMTIQPFVYSLFQKHGLISQNSTVSALTFNGARFGIGTLNEPIDKHLLRRYFPKAAASGELYKVGWGKDKPDGQHKKGSLRFEDLYFKNNNQNGELIEMGMIGEEDKFNYYTPAYDAKEFDKNDTPKYGKLINLMRVLKDNENKTPAQYQTALEAVVDIPSFLSYAALSYLTGNPDDLRNNGNNYYIFFNPGENNKAYFIPYDYDWSLGLKWNDADMADLPLDHSKMEGNNRVWQEVRLYWYTIVDRSGGPYNITRNDAYYNEYKNNVFTYFDDSYYTTANYSALHALYKNTYQNLTAADVNQADSYIRNTDLFASYYNKIKDQINSFR